MKLQYYFCVLSINNLILALIHNFLYYFLANLKFSTLDSIELKTYQSAGKIFFMDNQNFANILLKVLNPFLKFIDGKEYLLPFFATICSIFAFH